MYHEESTKIFDKLKSNLTELKGGTQFTIGNVAFNVEGKDGLGGLIEEWFGLWAVKNKFKIKNPKKLGGSQEFPDYYVGDNDHLLEVKSFDITASANFDLANFESYCESVSKLPARLNKIGTHKK